MFCRGHLTQLRQDYERFQALDVAVVVIGPEDKNAFVKHFEAYELPFVGIPDPNFRILELYGQQVKLTRMGRLPAQLMVDADGSVRYAHYGSVMADIPTTNEMLELAASLQ